MISMPDPSSIIVVADWIELFVATTGRILSKASLSHFIEGNLGNEPSESFISDIWRELICRQKLYDNSPFEVYERTIKPKENLQSNPEYLVCLILSLFGVHDKDSPKLFERLTCRAVEKYLSGEAFVIGWPTTNGQPASIKQKCINVADRLNERFVEPPSTRYKDRGVDIVGWKPFSEGRSGQVVVLLQCAAGHDWAAKRSVPLGAWQQYIHWAYDPVKAFAVPGIVTERDWHDKSRDNGIIFDRIRITNLLPNGTDDGELSTALKDWVKAQLDEIN